MLVDDCPLRKPLGAGGGYVVLAKHLNHAGTHITRQTGKAAEGGNADGKNEVLSHVPCLPQEAVGCISKGMEPRDGEPSEPDAKQIHEEETEPEKRSRKTEENENRC